ncbi:hypothetical protein GCM10009608_59690 [Pseudonocardia alaniniphila]
MRECRLGGYGYEFVGRKVQFESVDAMRVVDGKITEHWGVGNLLSLLWKLGNPPGSDQAER